MVVILGKTWAFLQSCGDHACLTGAGWISAVDHRFNGGIGPHAKLQRRLVDRGLGRSGPSTTDRAADTAVDRVVDHGPWVHRELAKGVHPELICAVHWRSGDPGDPQAMRGGGNSGARRGRRRSLPELA
jgi:hypothetical protein